MNPKSKKKKIISVAQQLSNQLSAVNDKFKQLKKLREQIGKLKSLYAEHDQLMEELLPLFIEKTPDTFIVKREVTVGTEKYRFTPFFYDEKKALVRAKVWKSTAFESGTIE